MLSIGRPYSIMLFSLYSVDTPCRDAATRNVQQHNATSLLAELIRSMRQNITFIRHSPIAPAIKPIPI
jgi:hypothetical protein